MASPLQLKQVVDHFGLRFDRAQLMTRCCEYVNPTQVYVNPTQVYVNTTQVYVNPTQVYVKGGAAREHATVSFCSGRRFVARFWRFGACAA